MRHPLAVAIPPAAPPGGVPERLFVRAVAVSVLAHGAALFLLPAAGGHEAPPLPPAIEVSLGEAPAPSAPAPVHREKAPAPVRARPSPRPPLLTSTAPAAERDTVPEAAPAQSVVPAMAGPAAAMAESGAGPSPVRADGGNGGGDSLPYVIDGPPPTYPADARLAGHQGRVRVRVLISEQGGVLETQLLQSTGAGSLDEAALAALRRWRFRPARREGKPMSAWVVVPVVFALR